MSIADQLRSPCNSALAEYREQFKKATDESNRNLFHQMAFAYIRALYDNRDILHATFAELQEEINAWKPDPELHEYAFDVDIKAVVRIGAVSEMEALRMLETVSGYSLDDFTQNLKAQITEFSIVQDTGTTQPPILFELDKVLVEKTT